jgi:Flp pilus assembly pilin Flp
MRTSADPAPGAQGDIAVSPPPGAQTPALNRLQREEDGATAVEFALIAVPFVTMLLGIISVCLYFFTVLELEHAVWEGSRAVRVGAYGNETGDYAKPTTKPADMTTAEYDAYQQTQLQRAICARMRDETGCRSKLRVIMQSRPTITNASTGTLAQPNCRQTSGPDVGKLISANAFDTTGASSFVVLTGCYAWDFGGQLPFFKIGNMPDGSFLVQSTFAFVNENYN